MVDKTLTQLISDTETLLRQVAGLSTQVYAQDVLVLMLNQSFELIFDYENTRWKRFDCIDTFAPDGVTGKSATALTLITRYEDVKEVFLANTNKPLAKRSLENNIDFIQGRGMFYGPSNDDKVLVIYPNTATDLITVTGQTFPSSYPFELDDVVPFDSLALSYMTAWKYAVDDATNPAMVQKFQGLFELRLKQLMMKQDNEPVSLTPYRNAIPGGWTYATDPY